MVKRKRTAVKSHSPLREKVWAVMTYTGVEGVDLTYDEAREIAARSGRGHAAMVVTNNAAMKFVSHQIVAFAKL